MSLTYLTNGFDISSVISQTKWKCVFKTKKIKNFYLWLFTSLNIYVDQAGLCANHLNGDKNTFITLQRKQNVNYFRL